MASSRRSPKQAGNTRAKSPARSPRGILLGVCAFLLSLCAAGAQGTFNRTITRGVLHATPVHLRPPRFGRSQAIRKRRETCPFLPIPVLEQAVLEFRVMGNNVPGDNGPSGSSCSSGQPLQHTTWRRIELRVCMCQIPAGIVSCCEGWASIELDPGKELAEKRDLGLPQNRGLHYSYHSKP